MPRSSSRRLPSVSTRRQGLTALLATSVILVLVAGPAIGEPDPRDDRKMDPKVGGRATISSVLDPMDRPVGRVATSAPTGGPTTDTSRAAAGAIIDADCSVAPNPVVCENALPGAPASEWDIPTKDSGGGSIAGFATQMSVNHGETVDFKIRTDAAAYTVEIYRLGYYQGLGARHIASVAPSAALPQTQPSCLTDLSTNLVDCGTWAV
ncbi:hypothetical protein, partial [Intrasporangium oryzae]|uniref:hypothetical protein n=1 Tax=Intrasporangium oryzae TaxID=412687 RepID=UPI000555FE51